MGDMRNRRPWSLQWLGLALLACLAWGEALAARADALRIGLTPVFLDDQPRILRAWQEQLAQQLDRPVSFVKRGTYREITNMLLRRELDAAWLCGLPYVNRQSALALVAAPLYQGAPLYRSYLLVHKDDTETNAWRDLTPGVFAYSDPDSNSGYLYPRWAMRKAGIDPDRHFRRSFFAHSHRNVIEAVASGLADAGAVDGYVWDTLARIHPKITTNTRVVKRSETFGFPPIVARLDLPEHTLEGLRDALTSMDKEPQGRAVLQQLNLDGFVEVKPALYRGIAAMVHSLRDDL